LGDLEAAFLQQKVANETGLSDLKAAVEKSTKISVKNEPESHGLVWDAIKANREVDSVLLKDLFPARPRLHEVIMVCMLIFMLF
jgi:hypothetical protein